VHKLLARQLAKATTASGAIDIELLGNGCLPSGVLLLPKPNRRSALAHMVRQAVGSDRALNAA
jgi:hypothetical protein